MRKLYTLSLLQLYVLIEVLTELSTGIITKMKLGIWPFEFFGLNDMCYVHVLNSILEKHHEPLIEFKDLFDALQHTVDVWNSNMHMNIVAVDQFLSLYGLGLEFLNFRSLGEKTLSYFNRNIRVIYHISYSLRIHLSG